MKKKKSITESSPLISSCNLLKLTQTPEDSGYKAMGKTGGGGWGENETVSAYMDQG